MYIHRAGKNTFKVMLLVLGTPFEKGHCQQSTCPEESSLPVEGVNPSPLSQRLGSTCLVLEKCRQGPGGHRQASHHHRKGTEMLLL